MILIPATPAIAAALRDAAHAGWRVAPPSSALPCDAVLTGRGGGSVGVVFVRAGEAVDEAR